ncbi:MAG: hypothetical protein Q9168_007110 [Polycauliona sp. 1 TL-2023]
MAQSNHLKNIAIVGATGTSGKYMVESLLATGTHTITALTREGGNLSMPAGITTIPVNYSDPATLVSALRNQDCLIITMGVRAPPDQQSKLIHAAASAGVKWILPNEYGYDTANDALSNDIRPGTNKKEYTALIEKLGVSKWTGFTCGFWYEFSLGGSPDRFGFDFKNKECILFDEGTQPISVSTFPMVGKGVASLLSLPIAREEGKEGACLEDFANKFCYVASFVISQKDMLDSVLRVTKTEINFCNFFILHGGGGATSTPPPPPPSFNSSIGPLTQLLCRYIRRIHNLSASPAGSALYVKFSINK